LPGPVHTTQGLFAGGAEWFGVVWSGDWGGCAGRPARGRDRPARVAARHLAPSPPRLARPRRRGRDPPPLPRPRWSRSPLTTKLGSTAAGCGAAEAAHGLMPYSRPRGRGALCLHHSRMLSLSAGYAFTFCALRTSTKGQKKTNETRALHAHTRATAGRRKQPRGTRQWAHRAFSAGDPGQQHTSSG
jgi:hypothetical protein